MKDEEIKIRMKKTKKKGQKIKLTIKGIGRKKIKNEPNREKRIKYKEKIIKQRKKNRR